MPKLLCGRQLAVGTHSSREQSGLGAWVQESAAESSKVGVLTHWMFKVPERRQRMILSTEKVKELLARR